VCAGTPPCEDTYGVSYRERGVCVRTPPPCEDTYGVSYRERGVCVRTPPPCEDTYGVSCRERGVCVQAPLPVRYAHSPGRYDISYREEGSAAQVALKMDNRPPPMVCMGESQFAHLPAIKILSMFIAACETTTIKGYITHSIV
jgi:hypothetical protein